MKKFYNEEELVFAEKSTHGLFKDLEGQKFGRLTVIGFASQERGGSRWFCKCDCGNITKVEAGSLNRMVTISCGCLGIERVKISNTTHGHTVILPTKTYNIWKGIIKRCLNHKSLNYFNYGGRGIKVCDRWLKFENFLEDMGERPENMTIDRILSDGNYEPGNCRWATMKEQNNNKRNNRLLTLNGKTQTMTQWADELGINKRTLCTRINKLGWSTERALTVKL